MDKFLPSDHPSASTEAAQFLFAVDGGLFLVEAENALAVQAVELLAGEDQRPGPGCELVAVFRDCGVVGLRGDRIASLGYAEFLVSIADQARILETPGLKECIAASLSDEDREQMAAAVQRLREAEDEADDTIPAPPPSSQEWEGASHSNLEKLSAALSNLGFGKRQIRAHIASLDEKAKRTPLEDLVKESLRALTN